MLESTTTLIETATVAGATGLTGKTAVKVEENENGERDLIINKKRALIGTSLSSTVSSATYGAQEASYQNTLRNIGAAQAYVESLDDESLAELSEMLDKKQSILESSEQVALCEVESKQPYVKK